MTKKQHYIPQFYLRLFTSSNKFNCFNVKTFKRYTSSIEDICCQKHLYEVDKAKPDNELENYWASIEGCFADIIKCLSKSYRVPFNIDLVMTLTVFGLFQLIRTPRFKIILERDIIPNNCSIVGDVTDKSLSNIFLLEHLYDFYIWICNNIIIDKCEYLLFSDTILLADIVVLYDNDRLYIPLNNKLVLLLYFHEKSCVLETNKNNIQISRNNSISLDYYNRLQILNCSEFIFSEKLICLSKYSDTICKRVVKFSKEIKNDNR